MTNKHLVKPAALKPGDAVGVLATSSPLFEPGKVKMACSNLSRLELRCKLGKHLQANYSDYAGTPQMVLEDLHGFFADPDIKAIIPIRGGNGSVRLLPALDFELIANNPKIFVGFSDLTGLIIPIYQKCNLVTFHGSMVGSFCESQYTFDSFKAALMSPIPIGTIVDPPVSAHNWHPHYPPPRMIIAEGTARGVLTGGCLTLVRQLMGTPYEMDTAHKIVLLEDINEEPHQYDRRLTQLLLAGKLHDAAGIIIGECWGTTPGSSNRRRLDLNQSLENVLHDRLGNLGIPVIYGLRIGHTDDRLTLPLGVMASLKVSRKDGVTFTIEESATHG